MENPNEDTQWNDALRSHGILPQLKKNVEMEVSENQIVNLLEETVREKTGADKELDLDELDLLEDEEEEAVLALYRAKRLQEMKAEASKSHFGELMEISGVDYVNEVNKAGKDVWVVLHLYQRGLPLCALINKHLQYLAGLFPKTKFIKSIATTCIPNYPERNVPTIFIYFEGELKEKFIGPIPLRGPNISCQELEFMLGAAGAIETKIKKDPRKKIKDNLMTQLGKNEDYSSDED